MQVKQVPIADILVPEVRVTAVYDPELTEQLRGSLDAVGQLQPIQVVETEEGYELVDGLHRLEEARRRGEKEIPAVIAPGDSTTAMVYNLVSNRTRGKIKASEMVTVIERLVEEKGWDSDQIREATGFTRDYIERLQMIAEADYEIRDALDRELIGVGVAYELSRLPTVVQQRTVLAQAGTFKMKTADVKRLVDDVVREMDQLANAPPPQVQEPPPPPPPPACEGCKDQPDPNLLTQVLLCPKCFGQVYELNERAKETPELTATEAATP